MKYSIAILALLAILTLPLAGADKPPQIIHEPVKAAVRGMPLLVRATIKDDSGRIKEANLFCSASRDSAPFKIPMQPSGAGAFIATIPESLVQNASEISYYIEAKDALEQTSETPWYTINFRTAQANDRQVAPGKEPEKKSSWKKPALIAGGTALAIGAGVALYNSGSSGDGGTSPSDSLFEGSATRYFQLGSNPATSETYFVSLYLTDSGRIISNDLHPGDRMENSVTLNSFTLIATVSSDDMSGQVNYNGTVVGSTITGSINGSVVDSGGTNGTYSGIFRADKK